MPSWLCDSRIFAAWAVTAEGDADLPDGTHLRLAPSTALGMPLSPFLLWDVEPVEIEVAHAWSARDGRSVASPDLDAGGGELVGWPVPSSPQDARLVGVEGRFHGGNGEIALVEQKDAVRVSSARSERRWLVAAPKVTFVRLRGSGTVTVHGWGVSAGRSIEALLKSSPVAALSAPVDPGLPWYADGEGTELAMQRVADGAPRRLTPPDRPDGPLDQLPPAAEIARVESFRATVDDEVQALFGDPRTLPSRAMITRVIPAAVLAEGGHRPWQRLSNPVLSTLLMKAMDPGAARYLGLMTTLPNPPPDPNPFLPAPTRAILAAGLFACPAETVLLPAPDAQEQALMTRLLDLQPGLRDVADVATRIKGVVLRAFATSTLVAPPPDPVATPDLATGDRAWLRDPVGPSTKFRQQIRIEAAPLAPLVAVGREEPGGWVSQHEMVDVDDGGGGRAQRAAARLVGTVTTGMSGRYGILAESALDADGVPWRYRVALGDLFGRFGSPAEILIDAPPRPAIPTPAARTQLTLGAVAAGDGPASPGSVRATVSVPSPHRLTAGSRALSRVVVDLDGVTQDAAAPAGDADKDGEVVFDFELPALLSLESRVVTVSAHFADEDGAVGPSSATHLTVTDGRSPPVPPTGIGIVWSSRPSAATDVEFRLQFTGTPNARYRVYLTDARGLDLPTTDGTRPLTRAEIAVRGAQLGLDGVNRRDRFRLLTEPALHAGGDGVVRFDSRLPRSLETVQFLRFVPVGAHNSEAPFGNCPLLPIAVPSDRRPPAPRVSTTVDAETGVASVTVTAAGMDLVSLRSAEPGLFEDPVDADTEPPEYRLRRASGSVPEAIYAREVARGPLHRDGEALVASVEDPALDGLVPYVRYFYWAEVRHPAERRVPRGVLEVALPSGAIVPALPAQRENAPACFSAPSAPAMAVHVPAEVATLSGATVTASVVPGALPGTFTVTVLVTDGPLASPHAQPGFTVQLHWQVGESSWTPVPDHGEVTAGTMTASFDHASADPATRLALVLVDPVGREAQPLMVDVAAR